MAMHLKLETKWRKKSPNLYLSHGLEFLIVLSLIYHDMVYKCRLRLRRRASNLVGRYAFPLELTSGFLVLYCLSAKFTCGVHFRNHLINNFVD